MKTIIITIGILLTIFGLASFAYHRISFTPEEVTTQADSFQLIYQKLNILAISPTAASIIMAIGVVLMVYGFARKS